VIDVPKHIRFDYAAMFFALNADHVGVIAENVGQPFGTRSFDPNYEDRNCSTHAVAEMFNICVTLDWHANQMKLEIGFCILTIAGLSDFVHYSPETVGNV
jgi:hypothetical protein